MIDWPLGSNIYSCGAPWRHCCLTFFGVTLFGHGLFGRSSSGLVESLCYAGCGATKPLARWRWRVKFLLPLGFRFLLIWLKESDQARNARRAFLLARGSLITETLSRSRRRGAPDLSKLGIGFVGLVHERSRPKQFKTESARRERNGVSWTQSGLGG